MMVKKGKENRSGGLLRCYLNLLLRLILFWSIVFKRKWTSFEVAFMKSGWTVLGEDPYLIAGNYCNPAA